MNDLQIASLLGQAALRVGPDLPPQAQELLFKAAARGDGLTANSLATYLHDHHPRTVHPPKPTAVV